MGEVAAAVRAAVAFVCDVPVESLTEGTLLADVGGDSLARVAVADHVEARLDAAAAGWRIPDDVLSRVATVGDLVDAVTRLIPPMAVGTGR